MWSGRGGDAGRCLIGAGNVAGYRDVSTAAKISKATIFVFRFLFSNGSIGGAVVE
jgi:hypothetical protein